MAEVGEGDMLLTEGVWTLGITLEFCGCFLTAVYGSTVSVSTCCLGFESLGPCRCELCVLFNGRLCVQYTTALGVFKLVLACL